MLYRQEKPRSLEDINLDYIRHPDQIDKDIIDLVRALHGIGLLTMGSCEGHLDGIRWPYPWVTVYGVSEKEHVFGIVEGFNATSDIKWDAAGLSISPTLEAHNPRQLRHLQESARDLAKFIFEVYIEPNPTFWERKYRT